MSLCAKSQLLEIIRARVAAVAFVHSVVGNGQASEGLEAAVRARKAFVIAVASEDDLIEDGDQSGNGRSTWAFGVMLLTHFQLGDGAIEGVADVTPGIDPDIAAAQIHAELIKAVLGENEAQWQLGQKARKVDCVGGGGVGFIGESGETLVVRSEFEIVYRTPFNNPGVLV
jgi:hypothetical protein